MVVHADGKERSEAEWKKLQEEGGFAGRRIIRIPALPQSLKLIEKENFKIVEDYFDISPESPEKWKKLEEMQKVKLDTAEIKKAKFEFYYFYEMKILYCKWKYKLHLKYLKYSSDDERLQHVPERLTVDSWKEIFKVFANEDFQALCSTNTNNRASQRIIASTCPTPFAQVEYDMMDEEIGEVPYAFEV
ncbi:hypothetical protein GH714_036835 [Hevea brasiliensis]|uniref:Uncharacterized protein n=1 Tax=Hevea brasiliensis TaxID=3981 RepID=A0A6A6NF26_HEVBR|nr:hypothetical protein GH714_036835 [Hevea brasiliensis]